MNAIQVQNLSKRYRLGTIGTGSLLHDLTRWLYRVSGKEDPYSPLDGKSTHPNQEFWALRDVNFCIPEGEVVGIVGRNGAGKSTLLKILSKVTAPTRGEVRIKGRIASLLEVGTGFHPELTGRENIFLNGAILGMTLPEIRRKLDEIIEFSGVAAHIDTPVKRYSSGMYVRLAFAVAAHVEPEILIVDEVLAVGDLEFQRKCLGKMKEVSESDGRTVLFVSHSLSSISSLCSSVIYLDGGQVREAGDTEPVLRSYLDARRCSAATVFENRQGVKGKIEFRSLSVLDASGQPNTTVACGETLTFKIGYTARNMSPGDKIRLLIGVYNAAGEGCARFDSEVTADGLDGLSTGDGIFECKLLDPINLVPGPYWINLAALVNREGSDHVADAFQLEIVNRDFFGTGRELESLSLTKVFLKHKWKIEQCP